MSAFPSLIGRRVLVTGATGLFGRALVDRLLEMGVRLRTTSRRPPPPDFPVDRVEHLVGDLADQSFARRATKDMHGLFHLAGRARLARHPASPGGHHAGREPDDLPDHPGGGTAFGGRAHPLCQHGHGVPAHGGLSRGARLVGQSPSRERVRGLGQAHRREVRRGAGARVRAEEHGDHPPGEHFGPHDDFAPDDRVGGAGADRAGACRAKRRSPSGATAAAVRDLLYVSDAVDGMLLAYEKGVGQGAFNIGSGRGYSIEHGRRGSRRDSLDVEVNWDTTEPRAKLARSRTSPRPASSSATTRRSGCRKRSPDGRTGSARTAGPAAAAARPRYRAGRKRWRQRNFRRLRRDPFGGNVGAELRPVAVGDAIGVRARP